MPRKRTESPSVPTMKKWLEVYLVQMDEMVQGGRVDEASAKKIAKGLAYAIAGCDQSLKSYRKTRVQDHQSKVKQARQRLLVP